MATVKLRVREMLAQREDREQRRIRLTEVAGETKLSVEMLTLMLNNEADQISLTALAELCDYFHCTPGELLRYDGTVGDDDAVDARDIVDKWEQQYGADEHPRT